MNFCVICFKIAMASLIWDGNFNSNVCFKNNHAVERNLGYKCKRPDKNPKTDIIIRSEKDLIDGMVVELYGIADSTKMGPCLNFSDTGVILQNYDSWPNQLFGKHVTVKGKLKLEKVPYHPDNEFQAYPRGDFWWIIPESIQLKD